MSIGALGRKPHCTVVLTAAVRSMSRVKALVPILVQVFAHISITGLLTVEILIRMGVDNRGTLI